jgi:hypothetical protein
MPVEEDGPVTSEESLWTHRIKLNVGKNNENQDLGIRLFEAFSAVT